MLSRRLTARLVAALCTIAALAAPTARGGELAAFNAEVAAADRHQRSAEFYLRTGNPAVAAIELDALAAAWEAIAGRYAASPPDAFAGDAAWSEVIGRYGERVAGAAKATEMSETESARQQLGEARAELAALRARNRVRVFSDELDELEAATAHLFEFRREPPAPDDAARIDELKARAAVVVYLLRRCRERAPAAVAGDRAFTRSIDEGLDSARRLVDAVNRGDMRTVVNDLRELRPIVRMLVLNYG